MPELAEVETVRADVEALAVGRRIVTVEALGARTFRRYGEDRDAFVRAVRGRVVDAVGRHGKYLLVGLDGTSRPLVIHLRMSGQLLAQPPAQPRPKHTHAVLGFDHGTELRFVDPRTFGELYVADDGTDPRRSLGPDALHLPVQSWALALRASRSPVKAVLLDQRRVAGIGNIYADEILHRARVHPARPAGGLGRAAVARIAEAAEQVLTAAIAARGSTLADAQYVDSSGRAGTFQAQHRVHARAGLPCLGCGRPIQRLRLGGRTTYVCPRCQR